MIIAVKYATKAVAKIKPEKNSGLNGIRTHDLCDTGAGLIFVTALVAYLTAMIRHLFIITVPQFKYMNFHIFTIRKLLLSKIPVAFFYL